MKRLHHHKPILISVHVQAALQYQPQSQGLRLLRDKPKSPPLLLLLLLLFLVQLQLLCTRCVLHVPVLNLFARHLSISICYIYIPIPVYAFVFVFVFTFAFVLFVFHFFAGNLSSSYGPLLTSSSWTFPYKQVLLFSTPSSLCTCNVLDFPLCTDILYMFVYLPHSFHLSISPQSKEKIICFDFNGKLLSQHLHKEPQAGSLGSY